MQNNRKTKATEEIYTNDLIIKKAGGSQTSVVNNLTTSNDNGKSKTLTHKSRPSPGSIKPKPKKKGKKNG